MKIRTNFVTNSSSSSYVILTKINLCDELKQYMRDEFGRYGLRLMDEMFVTGAGIKNNEDGDAWDCCDDHELWDVIEDESTYLCARFIAWTNDGDSNGEDAWLYEHIPDEYKTDIYETDP